MDDLQALRAALGVDEPPREVVDRSRHRLHNRIRGGRSARRWTGWMTAGTGLTVAVAAAAVALAATPATPVDGPSANAVGDPPTRAADDPSTKAVSGQDILLAAATAAEHSPEGSGAYWHTTVTVAGDGPPDVYEYWTEPAGRTWFRGVKTAGRVTSVGAPRPNPFSLVGVDLTLDQLRALPADPDALKGWIAEALERSDAQTSAGGFTEADRERALFQSLISLVSTLPAPPGVRAAAFRAIASYPGVQNLGTVPGGQGLLLPEGRRLVIDPATGRVNGTSVFITVDGAVYSVADPAGAVIDAEWTDTLPE